MNLDFRRRAMFCGMGKIALPINTRLLTHFDNNCEDSTGLNTPEFFGTASYKKGKFRNGVSLDGNSCVNVPYNADYLVFGTSDFTIAGWFKWDGTYPNGTLPRLFSQQYCYNNTYPMAGICVWINADGEIVWRVQRSSSAAVVSSKDTNVAMPVNEWAHVAMVRNGTALKLYLNGTEIGTATFNASYSVYQHESSVFRIGAGSGRASTSRTEAADFFSGEIDEFIVTIGTAIWTEAFTPPDKPYTDYLTLGSLPYGSVVWYDDPETGLQTAFDVVNSEYDNVAGYTTLFSYEGLPAGTVDTGVLSATQTEKQAAVEEVIETRFGEVFRGKLKEHNFSLNYAASGNYNITFFTAKTTVPSWETFGIRYKTFGSDVAVPYWLRGSYMETSSTGTGFIVFSKSVDTTGALTDEDSFIVEDGSDFVCMAFPIVLLPQNLKVYLTSEGTYAGAYEIQILSNSSNPTTAELDSAILDSMELE